MDFFTRVRCSSFACALTFATGAAAGSLVTLETEQEAASAIVAATTVENEAPGRLAIMTAPAFYYGDTALRALAAVTTPAELARKPGGMNFPCRGQGSFTASSARAAPFVVNLEFQGCSAFAFDIAVGTGPLRVTLLSNSFAVEAVAAIRLGVRERDFAVTQATFTPDQDTWTRTNYNYSMQGYISWPYGAEPDMAPSRSLYGIDGFRFFDFRAEIPGRDPTVFTQRSTARNVLVSASVTFGNDFLFQDDQLTYLLGAFVEESHTQSGDSSSRHDYAGLRVRRVTDYAAWTDSLELDGGVRVTWPELAGAGCLSGGYLFDTKTPLHRPSLDFPAYDSGELVINRDVNMRLYSPESVPPGLPEPVNGMLVHVAVKDAGSFEYDVDSLSALWPLAQCPY
jgi:hypothetical protein